MLVLFRFHCEILSLNFSHIKESNIVTYIAVTIHRTTLYQVLEFLQCSLRSYLPRWQEEFEKNKVTKVVEIMRCVVSGLRYLHDKRLVHFDLSMDTVAVCIMYLLYVFGNYMYESKYLRRPDINNTDEALCFWEDR